MVRRYERVQGPEYYWRFLLWAVSVGCLGLAAVMIEQDIGPFWLGAGIVMISGICLFAMSLYVQPMRNLVDFDKPVSIFVRGELLTVVYLTSYVRDLHHGTTVTMTSADSMPTLSRADMTIRQTFDNLRTSSQ